MVATEGYAGPSEVQSKLELNLVFFLPLAGTLGVALGRDDLVH